MRDHQTLKTWQEAHQVVLAVWRLSRKHWHPWAGAVFSQIQRSSLSVHLNIAEGWSFGPSPTCTRHLTIAFGSAVETIDLLDIMLEAEIVPLSEIATLKTNAAQCQQLLTGLLKRRRPFKPQVETPSTAPA